MHAWTSDPDQPGGLLLTTVPDPVPAPGEVLVRVDAVAPNPGDLAALPHAAPGTVPGWDGAGVVLRAAADGTGPAAGERVLFLGAGGGWAQVRAVPTATTGVAPTGSAPEVLSTLPVPATSALRAVRRLGSVLGRRVLVVGAAGAVGRAVVQLAARSGAEVVAVARDTAGHDALRALGASEVHTDVSAVDRPVAGAVDLVGGDALVHAYAALVPGGVAIALGHAASAPETFPYGAFVADAGGHDRSITSFFLGAEAGLADEMTLLAREVHAGRFVPQPVETRPWTDLARWVADGSGRRGPRTVFLVDHDA